MAKNRLRSAILVILVLIVITGLLYPGLVAGLGGLLFPHQARSSLVTVDGRVVGRLLIGQTFAGARYFHARPSAAGGGDDTLPGGANLGPTRAKLTATLIVQAADSGVRLDHWVKGQIPADLVSSSDSGLDPDIPRAAAQVQVARVARARGLTEAEVRAVVARHTQGRLFGMLGDSRVNVVWLNLALDSLEGRR